MSPQKQKKESRPSVGHGSIAIGGDVSGSNIVIGNNNVVQSNYSKAEHLPEIEALKKDIVKFTEIISSRLSLNEIALLTFDLGVDYDGLKGDSKSEKVLSLLNYLHQRNRLGEFLSIVSKMRPDISLTNK